ncbi:protein abrupt-like [Anopheles stephensi]|uniref:protein abrupt-like n=1 Tax=Anopheles stephensi TaxID=30069 RepID=UPI00165881AE|nr:protein abrupt-like [Anopheles stephensi]
MNFSTPLFPRICSPESVNTNVLSEATLSSKVSVIHVLKSGFQESILPSARRQYESKMSAQQQTFSLRWNDYSSYIADVFKSFRHEEDFVDVTLCCEGRKIRAHKMVLAACSNYFKVIFKETPCQHPIVLFKDVKYLDLVSLVDYMYHGEVQVTQDSLPSFFRTAELLAVRGLYDAPVAEQSIAPLVQQILDAQLHHMHNATDAVYYAPQQLNMESQAPVSRIKKTPTEIGLNSDNGHGASGAANSIMGHVPQQEQANSTLQPRQSSDGGVMISANTVAMATVEEQVVAQSSTSRSAQSSLPTAALQQLPESVMCPIRPVKKARVIHPTNYVPSPIKQEGNRNVTTTTTNPEPISNNESEMSDMASQHQDVEIPEFISGGNMQTLANATIEETVTQPSGFEVMREDPANHSEPRPIPEQSTDLKMPIVKMTLDDFSSDDEGDAARKEAIMESLGRVRQTKDKKHICPVCGKSFGTWKSLAMHSQIHTGRTRCSICGAVLSRTGNLKRHMKLRHAS